MVIMLRLRLRRLSQARNSVHLFILLLLLPAPAVPERVRHGGNGPLRPGEGALGQLRLFKYLHHTSVAHSATTTERTPERSLIPNSFFSPSPARTTASPTPTSDLSLGAETQVVPQVVSPNSTGLPVSERPRRSPYHFQRAPLYGRPPTHGGPAPYPTSPSGFDYGAFEDSPANYPPTPPEESSFNYPRFKRPPPRPQAGRRMPPVRRWPGGKPLPRPFPKARHGQRPRQNGPRRPLRPIPIPAPPEYSYPKDAANIQDILQYFQKEEQPPGRDPYFIPSRPMQPPAPLPTTAPELSGGSMGGDFSKELHDVQSSLLKDIREFARRPNMMGIQDSPPASQSPQPTYAKHVPPYEEKREEEEEDDPFEPKAKPVRDMIRARPTPPPRRDSEESRERERPHRHHRHKDRDYGDETKKKTWRDDESDEKGRRESNEERARPRPRPKYSASSSRPKYRETDSSYEERERDRKRQRERPTHAPAHYPPTSHSLLLKRPYGAYKTAAEALEPLEMQRKHHHWNSGESRDYYTPLPRPTPSSHYRPEPDTLEDVLEIHTDSPYRLDLREERERAGRERERKAALQKMYLDYLERKLEAERVTTPPPPSKTPMRMKISIYPNHGGEAAEVGAAPSQSTYSAAQSPPRYRQPAQFSPIHPSTTSPMNTPFGHPRPDMEYNQNQPRNDIGYNQNQPRNDIGYNQNQARNDMGYNQPRPDLGYNQNQPRPEMGYSQPKPDLGYNQNQPRPDLGYNQARPADLAYNQPRPADLGYNQPRPDIEYSHGRTGPSAYSPSGTGGTGTGGTTGVDKNKNLVLHLHVHRRNGVDVMEASASNPQPSTMKPLTYKEIYDEHLQHHQMPPSPTHRTEARDEDEGTRSKGSSGDTEQDRSLSMELPIQDEKIHDVLHTLLKLRNRRSTYL